MCGIVGYWATDSIPSPLAIDKLLEYGEKRGTDALGYSVYNKHLEKVLERKVLDVVGLDNRAIYTSHIINNLELGSVLLANYRAAPETEPESRDEKTIQPIYGLGCCLVHNGSVSKKIFDELSKNYQKTSELDSEAIIWAYDLYGRNMKAAMEYLSGGFAFLMLDSVNRKLFAVCSHNPLYCGYVRGHGLFLSSFSEAIYKTISILKGCQITRQNIMVWEDYYCREFPANTITEFDLESRSINETKFTPRYIHPKYDPYVIKQNGSSNPPKRKVLVSASGGLDSSTTLAILKNAGYDVLAVHFKYGHRGEKAEELALNKVCEILQINSIKFDLKEQMKLLDWDSMLVNKNSKITTGTAEGQKTTVAWTCFRNGLFVTYLGALAESYIINNKYDEVFITGGFLCLSESGAWPDNSERFIKSFIKFSEFASIVGTKIKPLYCSSNLLKTEEYIVLEKLGLLDKIGPWLVSCDRPKILAVNTPSGIQFRPFNCSKDGKPACGGGARSFWSAKRIGIKDPRAYYNVKDDDYKLCEQDVGDSYIRPSTDVILNKLQLHPENIKILRELLIE